MLVQLDQYVDASDIFGDYAYFSSYSDSWVRHAEKYVQMMCDRFAIGPKNNVIEVASNDGYLLQHFVSRDVPVLGVEPARNVANVANRNGIPTVVRFLGKDSAQAIVNEHGAADLVVANNVFAHVPDVNDFTVGLKTLLKPSGILTIEIPYIKCLIELNQFDTIYHEHFQYYSLLSAERVLSAHGLRVFDVEELRSHGGSLRLYVRREENLSISDQAGLTSLREREITDGFDKLEAYENFAQKVHETKRKLLKFLINAKDSGKTLVGYGAPGKGNTLLNYCGIRTDFLDFTVDRNPNKQGMFAPGTRIPILHPDAIREARPDYVMILPWNLRTEIVDQLHYIREWGGQFVVPIPEVAVF
jgi:2-polyprenyl-3-methyl-5-hydroxy-6-metoxy-1,4-benzoquinol methylase